MASFDPADDDPEAWLKWRELEANGWRRSEPITVRHEGESEGLAPTAGASDSFAVTTLHLTDPDGGMHQGTGIDTADSDPFLSALRDALYQAGQLSHPQPPPHA